MNYTIVYKAAGMVCQTQIEARNERDARRQFGKYRTTQNEKPSVISVTPSNDTPRMTR
jgi:hypothetical protein